MPKRGDMHTRFGSRDMRRFIRKAKNKIMTASNETEARKEEALTAIRPERTRPDGRRWRRRGLGLGLFPPFPHREERERRQPRQGREGR